MTEAHSRSGRQRPTTRPDLCLQLSGRRWRRPQRSEWGHVSVSPYSDRCPSELRIARRIRALRQWFEPEQPGIWVLQRQSELEHPEGVLQPNLLGRHSYDSVKSLRGEPGLPATQDRLDSS